MSNLGWSKAEPEVGGWRRCRPRRGRYARCRFGYRRLFEAIFVGWVHTAGSASLHPRLLIARPLRGRPCCRMLYYLSAPRLFNTQNRLFSHDCSVARKYAKIRNTSFSDTSLRSCATGAPKTRKNDTIWHKSTPKIHSKVALDRKFHGMDRKSMGWMAAGAPPRRLSNAKTQTTVGVRFNGLPYSAQGRAACTLPPARRGRYPMRRNSHYAPKPHSEAGDPIGVVLSITAGEPWANPRTSPNQRWDPMGVQLHATAGAPQAHPRTARCSHWPRPCATHPRAGTTSG